MEPSLETLNYSVKFIMKPVKVNSSISSINFINSIKGMISSQAMVLILLFIIFAIALSPIIPTTFTEPACKELFGDFSMDTSKYCLDWYECSGGMNLESSCRPDWETKTIPRECFIIASDVVDAALVENYCTNSEAVIDNNADCNNDMPPTLEYCLKELETSAIGE